MLTLNNSLNITCTLVSISMILKGVLSVAIIIIVIIIIIETQDLHMRLAFVRR